MLWYEKGSKLKGLRVKNLLRYANHSSSPNTEVIGLEMYALVDIREGEELTFHYGDDWV